MEGFQRGDSRRLARYPIITLSMKMPARDDLNTQESHYAVERFTDAADISQGTYTFTVTDMDCPRDPETSAATEAWAWRTRFCHAFACHDWR